MISVKTTEEIAIMREGGGKLWRILQTLLSQSEVGVSLQTIEDSARKNIKKAGGTPSFMTVKGYQWATCLCINDQVVHGIPSAYALQDGDLLTIDVGMMYKGFHTDTAWVKLIKDQRFLPRRPASPNRGEQAGKIKDQKLEEKEKFLTAGEEALKKAIGAAIAGNRVGHISQAIETTISGSGYSVVRTLTGHGVGRGLHEEPMIPEYLDKPVERTPLLTSGMTLAIEVIYAMGKGAIFYPNKDGWTLASKDGSLTAVFEQTIAVQEGHSSVLTGS